MRASINRLNVRCNDTMPFRVLVYVCCMLCNGLLRRSNTVSHDTYICAGAHGALAELPIFDVSGGTFCTELILGPLRCASSMPCCCV